MKAQSIQQFAIVQSDSAAAFEEELNARLMDLSEKNPKVSFDGLTAYVSYIKTVRIPETLADAYELNGACFHCEDCPEFQAMLKADGTEDKRLKYGECQYAEMRRTRRDAKACDILYKLIRDGRIGLCYKR
jgi:hypothetical protein